MAKLGISTGSQPNDGTGDTLLSGAEKVNANFTEVYTLCGDGTNLAPGIVMVKNALNLEVFKTSAASYRRESDNDNDVVNIISAWGKVQ